MVIFSVIYVKCMTLKLGIIKMYERCKISLNNDKEKIITTIKDKIILISFSTQFHYFFSFHVYPPIRVREFQRLLNCAI